MLEKAVFDYKEYNTIWQAEEAVGFPILIPSVISMRSIKSIGVIGGRLVNIDYVNEICYRVARGQDDISGDYIKYGEVESLEIERYHVTLKGFYGKVFLATWTDGSYTYSFYTPYGCARMMMEELIKSLTQVNRDKVNDGVVCPMVEYPTVFEAEYACGYNILVPKVPPISDLEKIYLISGKVAELVYKNNIFYRMAMNQRGDISGVYGQFSHIEEFDVSGNSGKFHVTAKGNGEFFTVAVWSRGGIKGSVYAQDGIARETIEELVKSLGVIEG